LLTLLTTKGVITISPDHPRPHHWIDDGLAAFFFEHSRNRKTSRWQSELSNAPAQIQAGIKTLPAPSLAAGAALDIFALPLKSEVKRKREGKKGLAGLVCGSEVN